MMKKAKLVLLLIITINNFQAFSQKFLDNSLIDIIPQVGFVAPHCEALKPLSGEPFASYEINFSKKVSGPQLWKEAYHNPLIGVDFMLSGLGTNPYLGSAYAVIPNINFQIAGSQKVFFGFRFGAGLGYLTKDFYTQGNAQNVAIGSHFNAAVNMLFNLRVSIIKNLDFITGIGFTHFSNGALKSPNLGINIPSFSAGISLKKDNINYKKENIGKIPRIGKKFELRLVGAFGYSDPQRQTFETTYSGSLTSYFLYNMNIRSRIGVAADIFYDKRTVEEFSDYQTWHPLRTQFWRPALSGAYFVCISNFSIILQLGSYLYTDYGSDGYVFERLGLQYVFFDHLITNLSLKAHFAKADHVEFGLGYKL